ncbi:hypothetical protein [Streptomyces sp. NPDC057429]|uniref:hypothetical protein n=1 Tax=Streptomyces sp. NPDC057429 TaxID=3346130 RepID=UPI0036B42960
MALLIVEFTGAQPAGVMIGDRALDTLVGAAVGLLAATEEARARAQRVLADPAAEALTLETARRRLTWSLVELRDAGDIAAGEWWQRALPEEQMLAAEQAGHRTLAATAQRQGLITLPPANGAV